MKIKSAIFASSNKNKLREIEEILGIKIEGTSLEIDEIQSLDSDLVAIKKAEAYFDAIKKPLFVEDTSLSFKGLNGLPGTYINDFSKALGNDGLVGLLKGVKDRSAEARVTLVYKENKNSHKVFEGIVKGVISKSPKGENGFGWDAIFIPNGAKKTFGQMSLDEKNGFSMRTKALLLFKKWLSTR